MESMTIEQLRVAVGAGGITVVTVRGHGGGFLVRIATRNGGSAVLAKARSTEPRQFGRADTALQVLRGIGITAGQFDASEWNPDEKPKAAGNRGRAEAMRNAHRAAAYNAWLAGQIQASIDDTRPNIPHDVVVAEMDADVAELPKPSRKGAAAAKC